jgi:hypothetical protein
MPALASTQLTSAITANQTVFGISTITTPTGSVGFPPVGVYANPQQPVMIDGEIMYLVIQNPAGTLQVRSRGAEGTVASAHDILANVYTGTPTDFGPSSIGVSGFFDPNQDGIISIGTTSTYTVVPASGIGNQTYNINTTPTAAAITLPAPLLSQNGTRLTFISTTAIAHVITATSLFQTGVGAQPKSTATFAAIVGAGFTVVAENGFWTVPTPSTTVTIT